MGRQLRSVCNVGISVALLAFLFATTHWTELLSTIKSVRFPMFLASYGLFLAGGAILSLRLHALLRPTLLRTSCTHLFTIWLRSAFFSMFLPSDVGAAVARWYMVTGNRTGRRLFVFVTGLERLMLISGALGLTVIPLYFVTDQRLHEFRAVVLPLLLVLLAICLAAWSVFLTPFFGWFSTVCLWCQKHVRPSWVANAFAMSEDVAMYRQHPTTLLNAFGAHALFQLALFLRTFLLFVAVDIDLPLSTILWISMLMILITTIPLSFAGMGVREIGFSWLVGMYGLSTEVGLLVGAMLSLQVVITAVLGGIVNMRVTAADSDTAKDSEIGGDDAEVAPQHHRTVAEPI